MVFSSRYNIGGGFSPTRSSKVGGSGGGGNVSSRFACCLLPVVCLLALFSLAGFLLFRVEDFAYQTKTIVGHNLDPTPWQPFPQAAPNEQSRYERSSKILQCQFFTCKPDIPTSLNLTTERLTSADPPPPPRYNPNRTSTCPEFFRWIHNDLLPWHKTRITYSHVMEAKNHASFRITISRGRLYVEPYFACVQSRMMITVWSILQLLKRYPGIVPDVDIMFDCMDKPTISRDEFGSRPLPLIRYCTTVEHFDIPFPDWSFWGWPEVNVGPWEDEFADIKRGASSKTWRTRRPYAYWKGNPDVVSPLRMELLGCNDTRLWLTQIFRQNWAEEATSGFQQSRLSNQCKHRFKIYAEGYAWSVSLKYILSCGSLTLIISPQYEDFFTRGLIPRKNYWPVSREHLCESIRDAVHWGNHNPAEAEAVGQQGQDFMETVSMRGVYDYMFHLISEYSKLQDFKPEPPPSAQEVCVDSILCFANEKQRQFLEQSATSLSPAPPCMLPEHDENVMQMLIKSKREGV